MKTLFKQPFPMLVATIVTTATLVACSNEMNPTNVSDGEPQAIAVRFATPSAGQAAAESPWQENDQVMVTPEAELNGAITFEYTKQEDGTYAWQNIVAGGDNYFKVILPTSFTAFYPTTEGTDGSTFTLPNISEDGQADQSSAALLHAADYMTAPPTTVAQVGQALDLTLAHRLCRLTFVVTEYGNEFNGVKPTLEDVKIKSQHQTVNLTYEGDQVEVDATGNPVWVSPPTPTNASDQPTYTAIVTPCDLTSGTTELMSLTVNGTLLPVKYKGNLVALASGSAYTFHLKVGKDYVTVTGSDVTGWMGETTDVPSKEVKKYFTAADLKVGDYYYEDGATSDGGLRKLFADGTFVMDDVMPESDKAVIGIVYWVGDATAKDKTLKKNHPECTHGLVVALSGDVESAWQDSYISVQEWLNSNSSGEFLSVQTEIEESDPLNNIQGYNNTKAIETFNAAKLSNLVTAVQKAVDYRTVVPTPKSSSDWYLPSAKELTLLCGTDVNNIMFNNPGTANRDLINGKLSSIAGADQLSLRSVYWASSELAQYAAFSVDFGFGSVYSNYKDYSSNYRVRFSLAF